MARQGQGGLAIIAGRGALPRFLARDCVAAGRPCVIVRFAGTDLDWVADLPLIDASFERLGAMFTAIHAAGCQAVVFAGGMTRPNPDPAKFDPKTAAVAPDLLAQLGQGDDAVLRAVARLFEGEGLRVEAAHELLSNLVAGAGVLGQHAPDDRDMADIKRAARIAATLGSLDIGQGAVVAQGLCLGLETLQGTDRMLDFVASTSGGLRPDPAGAAGVLFKAPKPGQDLRIDMPAIGPQTVAGAGRAGLAGIAVEAGGVLLLERGETLATADRLGLFIFGLRRAER